MTRLEALERIANAAQLVRDLEKMLVDTADARNTVARLVIARPSLDEVLLNLGRLEKNQ